LLLYSHERLIGGVQSFKKALESENDRRDSSSGADGESSESRWEKRRSHAHSPASQQPHHPTPNKLFFDEALGDGPEAGKDYLLSLMFSHFDQNNNGALEYEELRKVRNFHSILLESPSVVSMALWNDMTQDLYAPLVPTFQGAFTN